MTLPEALAALALSPTHTPAELRLAYKRAAFHAHPDRGGDTEALKRVNLAYELLGGKGDGGGFSVDVEAAQEHARPGGRKRQAHAPMPKDRESQAGILFECSRCHTVFVGGGLAVDHCTQVLPDKSTCGGQVRRRGAPGEWVQQREPGVWARRIR